MQHFAPQTCFARKFLFTAIFGLALAFTIGCGGSKATVADAAVTGNKRLADAPEMELEMKAQYRGLKK